MTTNEKPGDLLRSIAAEIGIETTDVDGIRNDNDRLLTENQELFGLLVLARGRIAQMEADNQSRTGARDPSVDLLLAQLDAKLKVKAA